ncbi:MAG TPA: VOC family protein [Anaerolineales bacterium]|nr:VOC family protein [Anaerolineales bacterium]
MSKRNIVHIEFPTADAERSASFYQQLFGWKITPVPEMNYTMWEPETGPGGGFSPVGENTKPGEVLVHVASDDIEADLKKVEKLGGKVVRHKTEIPGVGWWGVFTDPTGNMVAVYTDLHPEQ